MSTSTKLWVLMAMAMAFTAFVGTSAASATEVFTAAEAGETVQETTTEEHSIALTETSVDCANSYFTGVTSGAEAATLRVAPTYAECDAFGFEDIATVTTNNCHYVFGAKTTGTPGHGGLQITGCGNETEGIQIEVDLAPFAHCIVDIPEQTISSSVRFANAGTGSIQVDFTASAIMVDVTESAGFCALTEGTHKEAGGAAYTGLSDFTTVNGLQYSP